MGTDVGEAGPSEPDDAEAPGPPKRRTSFVAPQTPDAASDLHDDDELAGALENEVSLLTASLPIIRQESLFLPVHPAEPPYEPRTDAEREIAAQAESGDTLAAIERLEALLSGMGPSPHDESSAQSESRSSAEQPAEEPELDADVGGDADDEYGLTPIATPRVRASRLFWLWFAIGASVLVVGLGAVMVAMRLNVIQVVVAALLGIALSFVPLGLTSLTGGSSERPRSSSARRRSARSATRLRPH